MQHGRAGLGDNPAGMTAALPSALRDLVEARFGQLLERCRAAGVPFYDDAGVSGHVRRVLAISDFAFDSFHREPQLLAPQALALMSDPRPADARAHELDAGERAEAEQLAQLRRFRRREALRLIWRDVNALDEVEDTLAGARRMDCQLSPRGVSPIDTNMPVAAGLFPT